MRCRDYPRLREQVWEEVLPNGLLYTEKNGTYWVCVNVQTGVVEDIFYAAGIAGNG
jgi:hypothetical protein